MRVDIRLIMMTRPDMPKVLEIENQNFEFPWSKDDFVHCSNCIRLSAKYQEEVVGYVIYELHKNKLQILNIAVDINYQRSGVGLRIIEKLKGKLSAQRRHSLLTEVRESNLPALNFFKACGFRAISILKNPYEVANEDSIIMRFQDPLGALYERNKWVPPVPSSIEMDSSDWNDWDDDDFDEEF